MLQRIKALVFGSSSSEFCHTSFDSQNQLDGLIPVFESYLGPYIHIIACEMQSGSGYVMVFDLLDRLFVLFLSLFILHLDGICCLSSLTSLIVHHRG